MLFITFIAVIYRHFFEKHIDKDAYQAR